MSDIATAEQLALDCDPCIDRQVSRLAVILPANQNDGAIESALQQAATDMNVQLGIYNNIADVSNRDDVDAWIVTEVKEDIIQQLLNEKQVVFGWGWGYHSSLARDAAGWMASNDAEGGRLAAREFYESFQARNDLEPNNNETTSKLERAAYVVDERFSQKAQAQRLQSFQDELRSLQQLDDDFTVETLTLSSSSGDALDSLFQGCSQQAILFDHPEAVLEAMELRGELGCTNTSLGAFLDDYQTHLNPQLYQAITRQQLDFVLDPEIHLQASMAVVIASLYITAGKKTAFPIETPTYWTGPKLVHRRNVPSDTAGTCQKDAFPVCDQQTDDEETGDTTVDWLGLDVCPCTERRDIRIGSVLHGSPGGFWDPVFASARQAAQDMNVELDLLPFTFKDDFDLLVEKMSARIRNLCESGIDGMMVSIPHPRVAEAVQRCLDLNIPVISINSGVEESRMLGLMHHIGQNEYAGGFEAAQRLIAAGMTRGFCVDHEFGNSALAERCQGFKDAIDESENAVFSKHVPVPRDNDEEFRIAIEEAVGEEGDWEGVGFLQLSASSFQSLRPLLEEHPAAIAGAFDLKDYIYDAIEDSVLQFTIDQQPFLQGNLPIYLLTYYIYTRQSISNHLIQSGPSFVTELPSEAERLCEANLFATCPDRPEEDLSYIPSAFLTVGYILFGIIALSCVLALAWTLYFRELWVVKVSQPMFLALVVLGAFVSSLSILFMGAQTSYRLDQDESGEFTDAENPEIRKVDASCMAGPWLYGIGFVITFSALFAKILRVKLMFQAGMSLNRKMVEARDVMPVMGLTLLIELVILTCWQMISPLRWQREVADELDGYPTESVGSCSSGSKAGWGFFLGLMTFHVVCLCCALVLCYQTRRLSNDFAESSYVSLAVALLFQVLVLTLPILGLVHDNAEAFYFVRVAAVFLQNFSVLALIFVPKIVRMGERREDLKEAIGKSMQIPLPQPPLADDTPVDDDSEDASSTGPPPAVANKPPSSRKLAVPMTSWAGMTLSDFSEVEDDTKHSQTVAIERPLDAIEEDNESPSSSFGDEPDIPTDLLNGNQPGRSQAEEVNTLLSSDEVIRNWEKLGFPSEEFAQQSIGLLSRSTDSKKRRSIASGFLGQGTASSITYV